MIYYDVLSFVVIVVISVYKSIIYCWCFTHGFHPDLELKRSFKVWWWKKVGPHESPRDQVWEVVAGCWQNIRRIEIPASTHGFQVNSNHRTWTTKCLWIWDTNSCCTGQVVYVCIHGSLTYRLMCNIMYIYICIYIYICVYVYIHYACESCASFIGDMNEILCHVSICTYHLQTMKVHLSESSFLCNDDTILTHVISKTPRALCWLGELRTCTYTLSPNMFCIYLHDVVALYIHIFKDMYIYIYIKYHRCIYAYIYIFGLGICLHLYLFHQQNKIADLGPEPDHRRRSGRVSGQLVRGVHGMGHRAHPGQTRWWSRIFPTWPFLSVDFFLGFGKTKHNIVSYILIKQKKKQYQLVRKYH